MYSSQEEDEEGVQEEGVVQQWFNNLRPPAMQSQHVLLERYRSHQRKKKQREAELQSLRQAQQSALGDRPSSPHSPYLR